MKATTSQDLLRRLPKVDDALGFPSAATALALLPRDYVVSIVRTSIDTVRDRILSRSTEDAPACDFDPAAQVESEMDLQIARAMRPSLRSVINATGIIVHTNLGRSPLAEEAVAAVDAVARGYSTLEYDVHAHRRGSRHNHVEQLICVLTGAEAAMVVNNNAAAVLMVLSEFAKGGQAVVSRGELIEIGGSFRIPDIMALSGAEMVEVGTTNKTHLADYERAIGERTALLLKVHPSNYQLVGFSENVRAADLVALGHPRDIPVYEDQGSGTLFHLDIDGAREEPTVSDSLKQGCDLVSFSGDKLLGGPQAGIVVGSEGYIDRLKKNPLARAMRIDKLSLAALESTLRICLDRARAFSEIPTLRMLKATAAELEAPAKRLTDTIRTALDEHGLSKMATVCTLQEASKTGGGSLPLCDLPTWCAAVALETGDVDDLEAHLASRTEPPVIARISHDQVLFDVRTILDEKDFATIAHGIVVYLEELKAHE